MPLRLLKKFTNLIFPPKCLLCEKIIEDEDTLCCDCWKKITFIKRPFCDKCSAPFDFNIDDDSVCVPCIKNKPLYIKARSAVVYNNYVAKIIFKFKFYDKIHIKRFMAKCMVSAADDIFKDIDILIPTPLHKKRLIYRKYNQSLLLANEIARLTNKRVLYNFLYKTTHTTPQAHLKQLDRKSNLRNKFAINQEYLDVIGNYRNLNFAIIDDVITTGSTVNECIRAMNDVGINNVYAISFAKTLLN